MQMMDGLLQMNNGSSLLLGVVAACFKIKHLIDAVPRYQVCFSSTGRCRSNDCPPSLSILCSMIYRTCQTNVEWSNIGFNCPETKFVAVGLICGSNALAKGHPGPEGSTVVHGWISMCSVAEELETSGTDDVCEW